MSDEPFALSRSGPPSGEADYDSLYAALQESARGRWFLAEFARRNRHADTEMLLGAIARLESAMQSEAQAAAMREQAAPERDAPILDFAWPPDNGAPDMPSRAPLAPPNPARALIDALQADAAAGMQESLPEWLETLAPPLKSDDAPAEDEPKAESNTAQPGPAADVSPEPEAAEPPASLFSEPDTLNRAAIEAMMFRAELWAPESPFAAGNTGLTEKPAPFLRALTPTPLVIGSDSGRSAVTIPIQAMFRRDPVTSLPPDPADRARAEAPKPAPAAPAPEPEPAAQSAAAQVEIAAPKPKAAQAQAVPAPQSIPVIAAIARELSAAKAAALATADKSPPPVAMSAPPVAATLVAEMPKPRVNSPYVPGPADFLLEPWPETKPAAPQKPRDPLAPIKALTDEERIALFT